MAYFPEMFNLGVVVGFVLGALVILACWWWLEESWRFEDYPWWQIPFVVVLGPCFHLIARLTDLFAGWLAKVRRDSLRD
ncbi:hypothetical protein VA599_06035 [Chromobacterium sp. TRC.1.1.SA]|uniref:Uncharacterized protein n=1 Tax=Chromobacterium indicum TaxID=3110228 RepID=A0ABV0CGY6_9NEIS